MKRLFAIAVTATALLVAPVHTGAHRADTTTIRMGDTGDAVLVAQHALTAGGWPTVADGWFGPKTDRTVRLYQRANGLVVDGIIGPQTWRSLLGDLDFTPQITGSGRDVARQALAAAGASQWEQDFGVQICWRESRCRLDAVNQNHATNDNSWGPWQINYYGNLYNSRVEAYGHPSVNTSDWIAAARNFLKMGRTSGWCHWDGPNYCS